MIVKNTLHTKQRFNSIFPYYTPGRRHSLEMADSLDLLKKDNVSLFLMSKRESQKMEEESSSILF